MENDDLPRNMALLTIGVLLLVIALWWLWRAFKMAIVLLAWAAEQGFVGIAAYIACWVFLFPVMLAACLFFGLFIPSQTQPSDQFDWLRDRTRDDSRDEAEPKEEDLPPARGLEHLT